MYSIRNGSLNNNLYTFLMYVIYTYIYDISRKGMFLTWEL